MTPATLILICVTPPAQDVLQSWTSEHRAETQADTRNMHQPPGERKGKRKCDKTGSEEEEEEEE